MGIEDIVREGQELFGQGKFDEAAARFSEAVAAAPEDVSLLTARGGALMAAGRHAEAFSDFDRALELEPSDPRLFFRRGMARMAQKEFEAAIGDFTRAIELDHRYGVAFYSRGLAYDALGREAESQEDLRRAWVLGRAKVQGELDAYGIIRTDMDRR